MMTRSVAAASTLVMMLMMAAPAQSLPLRCDGTGLEKRSRLAQCMVRCEKRVNAQMQREPVDASQLGERAADAWVECLARCRSRHDMAMEHMRSHCEKSPLGAAASLRCEAALVRAEATRLSCHSHCEGSTDATVSDPVACTASCDHKHDASIARIHQSPRCQ